MPRCSTSPSRRPGRGRSPATSSRGRSWPRTTKGRLSAAPVHFSRSDRLDRLDANGLGALGPGLAVERHLRALGEGRVAVADDAGVMDEQVLASLIGSDEAEALLVREPLDGSGCHGVFLHGYWCDVTRRMLRAATANGALVSPGCVARPEHRTLAPASPVVASGRLGSATMRAMRAVVRLPFAGLVTALGLGLLAAPAGAAAPSAARAEALAGQAYDYG